MMEPKKKRFKSSSGISVAVCEDQQVETGFLSLPTEIICKICKLISAKEKLILRMVSRRLHAIISDSTLWKTVTIPPADGKNIKFAKAVLKLSKSSVASLSIMGYRSRAVSDVTCLSNCKNITALDLYGSYFARSGLMKLIVGLPNLTRLAISFRLLFRDPQLSLIPDYLSLLVVYSAESDHCFLNTKAFPIPPNIAVAVVSSKRLPDSEVLDHKNFSIYHRCYEVSQTCMPIENRHDNQPTIFSIGGITQPHYVCLSKAVSSSILSKSHLYNYATVMMSDDNIASSVPLNDSNGSIITSLNFQGCETVDLSVIRSIVSCTPNLLIISVNNVALTSILEPLDGLYNILAVHCKRIQSIFSVVKKCHVSDAAKIWENIVSLRYLEHLSICSCFFLKQCEPSMASAKGRTSRIPTANTILSKDIEPLSSVFKSMILDACENNQCSYSLQEILKVISDITTALKCLHVYIPDKSTKYIEKCINLDTITRCRYLEELGIFQFHPHSGITISLTTSSCGMDRLKHLLIENFAVPSIISDLVPTIGQNSNLQFIELRIQSMRVEQMLRLLRECPNLVSCDVTVNYFGNHSFVKMRKEAARLAKEFKLSRYIFRTYYSDRSNINRICETVDYINHSLLKKL